MFSNKTFAIEDILSKNEIVTLTKDCYRLMKEGNYEKSLLKARIALKYSIEIKDNNLIATTYNIIAANFDELTEVEKAFFYYKKGLVYANKTNNNKLKNWLNNNLGNIYCFDKKEYKTGINYYKKALIYSSLIKDSTQIVFTKLNITWAYFDIGEYKKGLPYLLYINKYHPKHGNNSTIVALNMLNGMYYNHIENTKKATLYFEKAIKYGNKFDEKSDLSFTHYEYSNLLFKTKQFKKAYENLKLFNTITNELEINEKIKKIKNTSINIQIDEYKREIDELETKFKTKEYLLLENHVKTKRISIIVICTLLLIIILFYFLYQNTLLKQKNKLIVIQRKIQENIINASISGQEIERKNIASFLHDNISALLSSASMHIRVHNSKSQVESEELSKTRAILNEAHDQIRNLSHELIPPLLNKFGLFFTLQDLCEKNSNSILKFEYISTIKTKTRYKEEYEMKMYFIIKELLNNITKHSKATKAKLILEEQNNKLIIEIFDNGQGFDTKKINVEFGINQIRARIKNMNGSIRINSKTDVGTSIYIKAPIEYIN